MLPRVLHAGAEAACGVQPVDERRVHHGARGADLADRFEGLEVARPLLVNLRGRLDEIPLDVRAGVLAVVRLRQHAVQDVAELMEERLDLVVGEAVAIEVGDEHRDRRAAYAPARAAHRPRGRVRELALARVEIAVDAADPNAALRHRARRSNERPRATPAPSPLRSAGRNTRLLTCEQPVERLRHREVPAQRLLVDVVAPLAQPLAVERHVPPVQLSPLERRSGHLGLQLPQFLDVPLLDRCDHGTHVRQKGVHGVRAVPAMRRRVT